jgi:hypothetical protein
MRVTLVEHIAEQYRLVREALLLLHSSSELLKEPDVDSAAQGLDLPSLLRRRLLPSQLHALRRPTWNCFLACLLQSEARYLELLHDRTVPVQTLVVHPGPLDGLLKYDARRERR